MQWKYDDIDDAAVLRHPRKMPSNRHKKGKAVKKNLRRSQVLTYLVWFLSIWCGLPHGHTITPDIRFWVKLPVVHTLWGIPFQGPFTCFFCLDLIFNAFVISLLRYIEKHLTKAFWKVSAILNADDDGPQRADGYYTKALQHVQSMCRCSQS